MPVGEQQRARSRRTRTGHDGADEDEDRRRPSTRVSDGHGPASARWRRAPAVAGRRPAAGRRPPAGCRRPGQKSSSRNRTTNGSDGPQALATGCCPGGGSRRAAAGSRRRGGCRRAGSAGCSRGCRTRRRPWRRRAGRGSCSSLTWENSGASSTPARPAKRLDSIQANVLIRSALMPASSVIRGLSTTARIRRPSGDQRNRAVRPTTATTVTTIVATWLPSSA